MVVATVAPTCSFLCTVREEVLTEPGLSSNGLSEPRVLEEFMGYFVSLENSSFSA